MDSVYYASCKILSDILKICQSYMYCFESKSIFQILLIDWVMVLCKLCKQNDSSVCHSCHPFYKLPYLQLFFQNIRKLAYIYKFIKNICQFLGADLSIFLKNVGWNITRNSRFVYSKYLIVFFTSSSLIILNKKEEF